jgi:methyltransferase (TIGR00027 family)
MKEDKPSVTAERVAALRAAHQLFDEPKVFDDPLALPILGPDAKRGLELWRAFARGPAISGLRAWIAVRSRVAEEGLARARERGTSQYVVLGAGLDTFAYRQPRDGPPLDVFEVDHPATQSWKQRRLREASIRVPPSTHFVATDFESDGLGRALEAAGFRTNAPAFFSWLGVTMYLTRPAILSTIDLLGSTVPGGGVVLDYFDQDAPRPLERVARGVLASRVALSGEAFRSYFPLGELAGELRDRGFRDIREVGPDEVNERYFAGRADRLQVVSRVGRLLCAER